MSVNPLCWASDSLFLSCTICPQTPPPDNDNDNDNDNDSDNDNDNDNDNDSMLLNQQLFRVPDNLKTGFDRYWYLAGGKTKFFKFEIQLIKRNLSLICSFHPLCSFWKLFNITPSDPQSMLIFCKFVRATESGRSKSISSRMCVSIPPQTLCTKAWWNIKKMKYERKLGPGGEE